MNFLDKVVLITGASSGIGAETAKQFAGYNAKLALAGRNVENLEQVANECKQIGSPDVLQLTGDLTNSCFLECTVDTIIKHFGQLDVLVNNAGILENGTIETTSMEQYDKVMNINCRSVYQLTHLAVPHLIKTKGRIVNLSSVVGIRAFPNVLAYCMSKAAIDHFTRCIALELAPKGVRVNNVNPGVIESNLHSRSGLSEKEYAEFLEKGKETHPLGRTGTVSEVANSILFLASDLSSFITGASLPIDGGKHASCPR